MSEQPTYTLAQIREGSGWPKGARFALVEPEPTAAIYARVAAEPSSPEAERAQHDAVTGVAQRLMGEVPEFTGDAAGTVARLLARGFNEHVKAHGPDGDGARPLDERFLSLVYDGQVYVVAVTPGPDLADGQRAEMHRTCGLLDCTDEKHLVLRPVAGERS
jgi:hypothetical protein